MDPWLMLNQHLGTAEPPPDVARRIHELRMQNLDLLKLADYTASTENNPPGTPIPNQAAMDVNRKAIEWLRTPEGRMYLATQGK